MASGVSGIGGYSYLGRLGQAQAEQRNRLFAKIDTNGDNSISKDEWTALQSSLTAKTQGTQTTGSFSGSALSLLSLLQNTALTGTTDDSATTASSAASTSFAKIDTNGDGSISKEELNTALSGLTGYGTTGAGSQTGSYTATETLFTKIDTNGDGTLAKDELAAFQSGLTTQLLNGTKASASGDTGSASTAAAFMQQAIQKYMQFTSAGQGISLISGLVGLG